MQNTKKAPLHLYTHYERMAISILLTHSKHLHTSTMTCVHLQNRRKSHKNAPNPQLPSGGDRVRICTPTVHNTHACAHEDREFQKNAGSSVTSSAAVPVLPSVRVRIEGQL